MNTSYVYSAAPTEFKPALLTAAGPASYSQATGDPLYNAASSEFIIVPFDCTSESGNYFVRFVPTTTGVGIIRAGAPSPNQSGWTARWFYTGLGNATGVNGVAITTAGTGGTNGTVTIASTGGGGTGATISVTTAGGIITAVKLLTPGTGYTSVPTFTIAAGTGAVTATIGSTGGIEVGTGVNLSAESIQFGCFTSQL
jgi:hypothetical protein